MKPTIPGRLHAQVLDEPRFTTARDVVRHLGGVQSQLQDMAWWAVGRRSEGLTHAGLREAFARGDFLRTHVLRPTWHLVDPDDIHWWLALTGPRIQRLVTAGGASIGLTGDHLDRGAEVVAASVDRQPSRTRAELAADLADAGLPHSGQALASIVMHAEINALVVSGTPRGSQHTYRRLEPRSVTQTRDELLARAARRYARGHGPFRDKDLSWWTSLTLTESRRAITLADLTPFEVDGTAYWRLDPPVDAAVPPAMLLSNFDEYISYARDPEDYAGFDGTVQDVMRGAGLLMIDGRLAGRWTRTVTSRAVDIVVESSGHVTNRTRRAVESEAVRLGVFLGRDPTLELRS